MSDEAEDRSFQEDIALFAQLMEREQETQWQQAELALRMTARYGRKTATMVSSETGLSPGYVRHLVATAKAFPTEESRAKDLSFSHHRIAAVTNKPEEWISRAIEAAWSVDQLREAVRSSKDRITDADRARRAEERILRLVEQYNNEFTSITGFVAEVRFRDLPAEEPEAAGEAA